MFLPEGSGFLSSEARMWLWAVRFCGSLPQGLRGVKMRIGIVHADLLQAFRISAGEWCGKGLRVRRLCEFGHPVRIGSGFGVAMSLCQKVL